MATIAVFLTLDERQASSALQEAAGRLEDKGGEVVLDFSSVRRIDSGSLRALEQFADAAGKKEVRVVLRGVNVSLYRTLKLVKLAQRFSFAERKEAS